jgi:molybdopterin molybdotransferase
MLSVEDALEIVHQCVAPLAPQSTPLAELLGLRLAQDVASDVDSPPFDKSMVDGYALAANDSSDVLRIAGMITAGEVPDRPVTPGTTIRVMTGAPVPEGTAAVVKWEDCEQLGDDAIRNPAAGVPAGACVLKRGSAFRRGEVVLRRGNQLGPLEIALLAEIGQPAVEVTPRPCVGVLPTGNELVEAHEACGPGQIRNSNGPMLIAAVQQVGASAVDLGVARDAPEDLREKIERGLQCDVLLVSGGVSTGVKDLVPGVLVGLGVVEHFHKVRMKPGKPLWFGTREVGGRTALVFGLPGNPVSTYVSFKLFVEPALKALSGWRVKPSVPERLPITAPFRHRGGRPTFHPARLSFPNKKPAIDLLDWKGSADLATLTRAHYLAVLPEGDYELPAGSEVEVLHL